MTLFDHVTSGDVLRVHAYARSVHRSLGLAPDAMPLAIVETAMWAGALRFAPILAEASTALVNGRWYLAVRESLPDDRAHWAIALALARWLLAQDGVPRGEVHAATLAGALLLPQDEVFRELREDGAIAVARRLVVPVFATLLREGELADRETAHVVAGNVVRLRGAERGDVVQLERAATTTATVLRFTRHTSRTERGVVLVPRRRRGPASKAA